MSMTIDKFKSYQLTQFIDENYPKEYLFSKREHEKLGYNGFNYQGKYYKVYTPELNSILLCKQLETLESEIINGLFYISDYVEGYLEGQSFFKDNYQPNINTLYGENARLYVMDIHNNFFHTLHSSKYIRSPRGYEGWEYFKKNFPILVNGNIIKEYGFFSGIVFEVEELIRKHYELFKSFDKCKHNLSLHQTENKTKKYFAKHYVLAYMIECHAKGKSIPSRKDDLQLIGSERIGVGKGNTFYKNFLRINRKDLNVEKNLIEIGGEDWREAVINLSNVPQLVDEYLQKKQL